MKCIREALENYDRWDDNFELTHPRVILLGNLSEGYEVVGPFNGFAAAADYAEGLAPTPTWIMRLEEPFLYE